MFADWSFGDWAIFLLIGPICWWIALRLGHRAARRKMGEMADVLAADGSSYWRQVRKEGWPGRTYP